MTLGKVNTDISLLKTKSDFLNDKPTQYSPAFDLKGKNSRDGNTKANFDKVETKSKDLMVSAGGGLGVTGGLKVNVYFDKLSKLPDYISNQSQATTTFFVNTVKNYFNDWFSSSTNSTFTPTSGKERQPINN